MAIIPAKTARLTFEVSFADAPRVDEAAELLRTLDEGFRAFAAERGVSGVHLIVEQVREGSLTGTLRLVGTALGVAATAYEHVELLRHFLMHSHAAARVSLDIGVIDPIRTMLAVWARPVAEGRADTATIGDNQTNKPGVLIDKSNAAAILARSPTPLAPLAGSPEQSYDAIDANEAILAEEQAENLASLENVEGAISPAAFDRFVGSLPRGLNRRVEIYAMRSESGVRLLKTMLDAFRAAEWKPALHFPSVGRATPGITVSGPSEDLRFKIMRCFEDIGIASREGDVTADLALNIGSIAVNVTAQH